MQPEQVPSLVINAEDRRKRIKKIMKTLVNKKEVKGIGFIWDGCHKIYIIQTPEELNEAKKYGYTNRDFYEMNKLKTIYDKSCPLRFIETFDLKNMIMYAPQCTYAIIEEA